MTFSQGTKALWIVYDFLDTVSCLFRSSCTSDISISNITEDNFFAQVYEIECKAERILLLMLLVLCLWQERPWVRGCACSYVDAYVAHFTAFLYFVSCFSLSKWQCLLQCKAMIRELQQQLQYSSFGSSDIIHDKYLSHSLRALLI